jgi:hypothetical protein
VDTGTEAPSSDVECYGPVEETDIACYDTDEPPIETDTGDPSIETDVMCYEAPIETDIECYDPVEDYPTDSEILISDAGPDDTDTWESDVECYAAPAEDSDPDGGIDN